MIPHFKMSTDETSGITKVTSLKDGAVRSFTTLAAALIHVNIHRELLCKKTHKKVAGEPFPVRSLVPNIQSL